MRLGRFVAGSLAAGIVASCAVAPQSMPDPSADALDLAVVWTVTGSTDQLPGNLTTYFNDRQSPHLRPGLVWVWWSCEGGGLLSVTPVSVIGVGAVRPPDGPTVLTFPITCPASPDPSTNWRPLSGQAIGGENAVVVRPVNTTATIAYRILFAQQP